jgi:hypothetical protein
LCDSCENLPPSKANLDVLARVQTKTYKFVAAGDIDLEYGLYVPARMKELGMKYEYIEVPGGTHASAGRLNIDKVFAFLDKQRKP